MNDRDEQTQVVLKELRDSYQQNRERWEEILAMDKVVLVCYCKDDKHCHRRLLKEYLVKCGAEDGGKI